jgi:HlyD family secretion protein
MHGRKRILIPIVLLLVIIAVTAWYILRRNGVVASSLGASGTVEAVEVTAAAELSGSVVEVLVDKGTPVQEGDALFRLDDTLLRAQRKGASTAIDSAQASLVTAQSGVDVAQATLEAAETSLAVAKANAQAQALATQKSLDTLNETAAVAKADAERAIAAANRAVREAQYLVDNFTIPTSQENLTASEAISMTQKKLDQARAAFEPYKNESSGNDIREERKDDLDQAQSDYDTAVRRMELETTLQQAQARLHKTQEDYLKVAQGPDPQDVAILEAQLAAIQAAPSQAEAAVVQARQALKQAQDRLAQAQTAIQQAQAELDLIDVQISKLIVHASISGMVISRDIEPGEVVQAGAPVITLGQLDRLKITVYIPEDLYGQISLGETAQVTVDSFPGQVFEATVVHIADKAEFTPRNVQTTEGRKTTVFAIELSIDNAQGLLKPGMPADVSFEGS